MGSTDDLATLSELEENSLLNELQARYKKELIYTYIGDILIAVNPYKTVDIYGPEKCTEYTEVGVRSRLPPHIYAISDAAYQNMMRNSMSQCCVVSGESGAGKTESTKLMIQHIAQLCQHDSKDDIHDRIVKVNPLLEAFGNAQTVINNNSSRFGKYIELTFDQNGGLQGAKISEYLLEKSRVVSQAAGEKNFHIFYYLFAGLDQQRMQANLLKTPDDHRIIRPAAGGPVFANNSEKEKYKEMWDTLTTIMKDVGFKEEETDGIMAILAAILHITDIEFQTDPQTEGVFVKNENVLVLASRLLAVDSEKLTEALISTVSSVGSGGETVTSLKNEAQANDGRDALAKALYGRLFSWIVYQVNNVLRSKREKQAKMTIGILDIYGFENFRYNSFEQLCINIANEQLQYFFNEHIFRWELEEYAREGVSGNDVKFVDNKPLLDLFLEPLGLFSLLDDESKFPQGTDQSFVDKLTKSFAKKPEFQTPKGQSLDFSIQHFAGLVTYSVDGFLEKNRDTLSENVTSCMKKSNTALVYELFSPLSDFGQLEVSKNTIKRFKQRASRMFTQLPDLTTAENSNAMQKRLSRMIHDSGQSSKRSVMPKGVRLPGISEGSDSRSTKVMKTLANQFKNSLISLMNQLSAAQPHFIRCVKPNADKAANSFNPQLVLQQLRYTGVLETVKIRKQGYPTRLAFVDFMQRYRYAASTSVAASKPDAKSCSALLEAVGLKNWQIGHTKVFLKYYHVEQLNVALVEFGRKIAVCQKYLRGLTARRKYQRLQKEAAECRAQVQQLMATVSNLRKVSRDQQDRLNSEDVKNFEEEKKRIAAQKEKDRQEREKREKEESEKKLKDEKDAKKKKVPTATLR